MKQSISIALFGAAAFTSAQINTDGLPECVARCVNNMAAIALQPVSEMGFACSESNLQQCACCNPNFAYGLLDCSRSTCAGDQNAFDQARQFGNDYCQGQTDNCPTANSVLPNGTSSSTTSSAFAGAAAAISSVSGSSNVYVVGQDTISAGGDGANSDDTTYTALPSGSGVLVIADGSSTTVAASAVGMSASTGMVANATMASSTSVTGLGAAAAMITPVTGTSNAYEVEDNTITAGGDPLEDNGTTYSALPSGAGVLIAADGSSTTVASSALTGAGASMTTGMSTGSSAATGLAAAAAMITPVSGTPNAYEVEDNTITAGGDGLEDNDTTYSALPSGAGVLIAADGSSTTVGSSALTGAGAGMTTSMATSTTGGNGMGGGSGGQTTGNNDNGSDSNNTGSSTGTDTGAAVPMRTAAPALIGAAAIAMFAL